MSVSNATAQHEQAQTQPKKIAQILRFKSANGYDGTPVIKNLKELSNNGQKPEYINLVNNLFGLSAKKIEE